MNNVAMFLLFYSGEVLIGMFVGTAAVTPYDWFIAELFEEALDLPRNLARVAQRIFSYSMVGAIDAWTEGHASQTAVERAAVRIIVAGTTALAAENK